MAGGLQHDAILAGPETRDGVPSQGLASLMAGLNHYVYNASALAVVAAGLVLTVCVSISLGSRLLFGPTASISFAWLDEVTIFLIAGAIFFSAGAVQAKRGHIGIEVLSSFLSKETNELRLRVLDALCLFFSAVFAWKSGGLLLEALHEGQTSQSAWGPPLWIPYVLLTLGMAMLALQLAFQVAEKSAISLAITLALVALFLIWGRDSGTADPNPAIQRLSDMLPPRQSGPLITGLSTPTIGILYCVVTLLFFFSGMPIAFALGCVALLFMTLFMPKASVDTIAQNFYEELANVIILAIPLFILKGAAIGRSNAGKDLYSALHAWLYKIPGGLGVANTIACGLFAAMAGSSPATCSAIGSAGIPEMRARGYSGGFAAGIIAAGGTLGILLPPSVTMLLYAVAAEEIGRAHV